MTQAELGERDWTRSYVSQMETGRTVPSLGTLEEIARRLDTPLGELLGDQTLMRLAKATLLSPRLCQQFLEQLPDTQTKRVLTQLAEALLLGRKPDLSVPQTAELQFLSAKVFMAQQEFSEAVEVLDEALRSATGLWRLRILLKLLECQRRLDNQEEYLRTKTQLQEACRQVEDIQDLYRLALKDVRTEGAETDLVDVLVGLEWAMDLDQVLEVIQ